jgi:oligopeptide transport system permease protein
MATYIIKRLAHAVIVLWVVITITFLLMHAIPGGPFTSERNLPPAVLKNIETKYKLNDPLYRQYLDYMKNLLKGDLGPSFKHEDRTVNEIITEAIPVSFQLGFESIVLAILVGIPVGIGAALHRGHWQDRILNLTTTFGIAVPSFILASLAVLIFAIKLRLLPAAMWGGWKYHIMPAITLSLGPMAIITRLTRSSMLDVLGQDYIKTAKAKGLSPLIVFCKHALPNALIPVVTYLGPMAAGILTGSFVIESIFAIPGIGCYFVTGIYNRDYTLILGVTIFYSLLIVVMNVLVDLVYPLLDPRIKLTGQKGE